ncbi:hypothetical protein GGX14DRAFT_555049 [Mycena pura]|uniref:DNA replication complex GINS protein PSF1 n=1 Tax=Mycena pura TaxID=153505 RepID=A0AAD6YTQ1_9AGAR|nr:hypothetical protein GGX14DRAFT_555049 [Mycena pura]
MTSDESYGALANQLVLQSKLSMDLGKLLPYDGPLVRSMLQEQKDLDRKVQQMEGNGVKVGHSSWPALVILVRVMHQNKRCLLAYHKQRLDLLQAAYWDAGGAVGHVLENQRGNMSYEEIRYLQGYGESVLIYREQVDPQDVMSLTMGVENPGRGPMVTVEVEICPGPIYTESGMVDFKPGRRYILRRADIEHLILQGYLREL